MHEVSMCVHSLYAYAYMTWFLKLLNSQNFQWKKVEILLEAQQF